MLSPIIPTVRNNGKVVYISRFSAQKMTFTADKEMVLECGLAKITLKNTGDIAIEGMMIEITAKGTIVLKSPQKTMEV